MQNNLPIPKVCILQYVLNIPHYVALVVFLNHLFDRCIFVLDAEYFLQDKHKTFDLYSSPPTPRLRWTLLRDNCFVRVARHTKRRRRELWLGRTDSNHDKENQNLLSYH